MLEIFSLGVLIEQQRQLAEMSHTASSSKLLQDLREPVCCEPLVTWQSKMATEFDQCLDFYKYLFSPDLLK